MFIVTQAIVLYVVNHYSQEGNDLPYGMGVPEVEKEMDFYTSLLPSIILAFVIALALLFLLSKYKVSFIIRLWFFAVVVLALSLAFNSFISKFSWVPMVAVIIAVPLAYFKIYQRNFLVHNFTEFLIYPGIAAVFVPIFNFYTIIILLIIISLYDAWAVWHSGIMQKMAKYQMDSLKVFSGFFIPYASKTMHAKIKKWKATLSKKQLEKKQIKVNVAILGGGDIVFPIITAGVMMTKFGFWSGIFVVFGALLGLSYLLFIAKKKKFYPAMPFITIGIFLGILASVILL